MESMRPNNTPVGIRGSPAPGTEGGSLADLSSSLLQSTEDMSQDMSSVLLLILSGTACTMEAQGEDQVMAFQAQNLANVELGNIKQSDLLAGPLQGEPIQRQEGQTNRDTPALCMRAEMGPSAAQRSALAESLGFLDVRVQNCQADLLASTVANIGPFLEDEFSVDGQPMRLQVCNITITMKDDGPRIYPTSPQPVPAKFVIDQLVLERGDDGFMRIKAEGADSKSSADVPVVGRNNPNSYNHVQQQCDRQTLESRLCNAQAALNQALEERERLLVEVRKYNPTFTL